MQLRKYTEVQLREAVASSQSLRQVLTKLGVATFGGNYTVLRRAIDFFGLDTSHFKGQGWSKGKSVGSRPLSVYLENHHSISSHKLRKRLLRDGVFLHQCQVCLLTTWQQAPIPLELDHVDGDNRNNLLSNLRLLCPNCHAQTSTYRGKNKRKA